MPSTTAVAAPKEADPTALKKGEEGKPKKSSGDRGKAQAFVDIAAKAELQAGNVEGEKNQVGEPDHKPTQQKQAEATSQMAGEAETQKDPAKPQGPARPLKSPGVKEAHKKKVEEPGKKEEEKEYQDNQESWFNTKTEEVYLIHLVGCTIGSYLLGRLGLSFLPVTAVLASTYFILKKTKSRQDRLLLKECVHDNKLWDRPEFIQRIIHDIPAWVKSPDWERTRWLQKGMVQMWPYIRKVADTAIRENVDPILQDSCPGFLHSIKIGDVNLGSRVPDILGVKNPALENDNQTIFDVQLFMHRINISLIIETLPGASMTVGIRDLTCKGVFRTVLWPLVGEIPLIGGVRLGFAEKPDFELEVQTGGLGLKVPGLDPFLENLVEDLVVQYFCWPNDYYYALLEESQAPDVYAPKGLLRVTIFHAKGLKADVKGVAKMFHGKIDPYIKVTVHGDTKQTKTVYNTGDPHYNQTLEFVLRGEAKDTKFDIVVVDDNELRKDKPIGGSTIDLSGWDLSKKSQQYVKLKDKPGQVLIGIEWKPYFQNLEAKKQVLKDGTLSMDKPGQKTHLQQQMQGKGAAPAGSAASIGKTGLLILTVKSGHNLEIADSKRNSSDPYVEITLVHDPSSGNKKKKKQQFKTTTKMHTLEPSWDEEFQFHISNVETDKIKFKVMDFDKFSGDDDLGECELRLDTMLKNNCLFDGELTLEKVKSGSLFIKARYMPN